MYDNSQIINHVQLDFTFFFLAVFLRHAIHGRPYKTTVLMVKGLKTKKVGPTATSKVSNEQFMKLAPVQPPSPKLNQS
jgi:hypothetical protein